MPLTPVIPQAPPHRPGSGTVPETAHLHPLIAAVPARVDVTNWETVRAYSAGFDLVRARYFWEAHEVWEAVWRRTAPASREYQLVRGLIQMANAELKADMEQGEAAMRISRLARDYFEDAVSPSGDELFGVSPTRLLMAAKEWHDLMAHYVSPPPPRKKPQFKWPQNMHYNSH